MNKNLSEKGKARALTLLEQDEVNLFPEIVRSQSILTTPEDEMLCNPEVHNLEAIIRKFSTTKSYWGKKE